MNINVTWTGKANEPAIPVMDDLDRLARDLRLIGLPFEGEVVTPTGEAWEISFLVDADGGGALRRLREEVAHPARALRGAPEAALGARGRVRRPGRWRAAASVLS